MRKLVSCKNIDLQLLDDFSCLASKPCRIFRPRNVSFVFQVLGRALKVTTTLGAFAISVLIDERRGKINENMRKRAKELRERLTFLGPTFVKIGQGLSTRPDLCPPAYLEELAELQVSSRMISEN